MSRGSAAAGAGPERAVIADVGEAEERRCRAVNARDWDTLRDLLDEGFAYHHWHGRIDDREGWLGRLRDCASYRTERESIRVDRYGDIAVVVGVLRNTIVREPSSPPSTSVISAVQVWSAAGGSWRECAHHSFKARVDRG